LAYFDKPKIAWGNLALRSQFSLIEPGLCINAPSVFISTDNLYLLAILNSKLADYYIKQLGVSRSGGYFEYKPMFVSKLPVPKISEEKQQPFKLLVETIHLNRKNGLDNTDIEHQIDQMVFDLYNLTPEERKVVNH
jgi:adenine-specific DNA-methyltransferase